MLDTGYWILGPNELNELNKTNKPDLQPSTSDVLVVIITLGTLVNFPATNGINRHFSGCE